MVIDFFALWGLVQLGQEAVDAVTALYTALTGEPEPDYADLTYEEKKEILKQCTLIIRRLDLDLNCYPLGLTTTLLFNEDGTPSY